MYKFVKSFPNEQVLKAMIEDLKLKTIHKLVEDYSEFRKENKK